jgi:hypothetical protein
MQKRFSVLLALTVMVLFIFPVRAQQELTQTVSAPDGSYSFMSPADWQWVSAPPNILTLHGAGDADSVTGQILAAPKKAGITPESVVQSFGANSTSAQINGQEVFYIEQSGKGLTAVVALPDQIVAGIFQGSDAAIKKQEATLLAVMGSVKSGTAASSASGATAPAESTTEAGSAPVAADLGEDATLAIVDGEVGGSTGVGNELYELNIGTKTGKSLKKFGTTSSLQFTKAAWSADGSQLAFYSIDPPGVTIIDGDGGNSKLIQGSTFIFAWSPDGKHITLAEPSGSDWGVKELGLDGGSPKRVLSLKNMSYVYFVRWSSDGKWLAYVGTPQGSPLKQEELHIIDAAGNNDQLIVPVGDIEHNVMWSADGTQLAYITQNDLTTFTIDSKATQVIAKQVVAADWSPNSQHFAYATRNAQLFISNADGSQPLEIAIPADLTGKIVSIAWRPETSSASTPVDTATATTSTTSPTPTTSTAGATSSCTVSAASGANLRSGPGTQFARAGALAAGTSQTVTGQAKSDNFVWWKLESGSWVRSDVVQTAGDCSAVPTVTS